MNRRLHDAWWRMATQNTNLPVAYQAAAAVLRLGSWGYGIGSRVRNAAYDAGLAQAAVVDAKIVSFGNLTVGGAGKTSGVEYVGRKLLAAGRKPAILSRGYGGRKTAYTLRWTDNQIEQQPPGPAENLADEPQWLARALPGVPVLVNRDRVHSGHLAVSRYHADTLLLDDGFQHRRLKRDCDIVLVQATMPFGGWPLLPRGPMREPMDALRRAHVVIVTKADEAWHLLDAWRERIRSLNKAAVFAAAVHEPVYLWEPRTDSRHDVKRLAGQRAGLVSSIGDPAGFEATVAKLHGTVAWHRVFPDHHAFRLEEWRAFCQSTGEGRPSAIITTEKDWVRLRPLAEQGIFPPQPVWVLGVRMKVIRGEAELDARLAGLYAR